MGCQLGELGELMLCQLGELGGINALLDWRAGGINALSTWRAGEIVLALGCFRGYWGWMEVAGVSYDGFAGLGKTRRLTSSPPVVRVHTKTRSRST